MHSVDLISGRSYRYITYPLSRCLNYGLGAISGLAFCTPEARCKISQPRLKKAPQNVMNLLDLFVGRGPRNVEDLIVVFAHSVYHNSQCAASQVE